MDKRIKSKFKASLYPTMEYWSESKDALLWKVDYIMDTSSISKGIKINYSKK